MIIIAGANRSGTSFATNLLEELGMDLGPRELLLGPDYRNPKGYFENKEILSMNISLLLGDMVDPRHWEDEIEGRYVSGFTRMAMAIAKAGYFVSTPAVIIRRSDKHRSTMERLVAKYKEVAVNDARFSSTLGAWSQYATITKVLYVYRHPAAVVRSLKAAYGLPLWMGQIFWAQRVREFFEHAEGLNTVMINYDDFFSDHCALLEMERLFQFIGKPYSTEEATRVLNNVRDEALRHNGCEEGLGELPTTVVTLYGKLNAYHAAHAVPTPLQRDGRANVSHATLEAG